MHQVGGNCPCVLPCVSQTHQKRRLSFPVLHAYLTLLWRKSTHRQGTATGIACHIAHPERTKRLRHLHRRWLKYKKKKNQSILTKSHANVKLGLAADKETSKILKRLLEKACARKTEQRFSGCPTNSFLPASSFYPLFISSPLKQTISVLSWAKELLCTIWLFLRITCALTTSSMWVVSEFISSSGMILKATRLFLFCPKGKNQFKWTYTASRNPKC